jgi:hypothetical protein
MVLAGEGDAGYVQCKSCFPDGNHVKRTGIAWLARVQQRLMLNLGRGNLTRRSWAKLNTVEPPITA